MSQIRPLPLIAASLTLLLALLLLALFGLRPGAVSQGQAHSQAAPGSFAPAQEQRQGLGDFGAAPAWTLTDQQERNVDSTSLAGKVVIADFIYTNCTDICPTLSVEMQQLQERLRAEGLLGNAVQLLSFTTDPARDTPAVPARYAAGFKADPDAWRFLTGPEDVIVPLIVDDFHLGVEALPPKEDAATQSDHDHAAAPQEDYEVMHSGRFVLIDSQGKIRAYYDGSHLDLDQVLADVRTAQLARQ